MKFKGVFLRGRGTVIYGIGYIFVFWHFSLGLLSAGSELVTGSARQW